MSTEEDRDAAAGDSLRTAQDSYVPTTTAHSEAESNQDQPAGSSLKRAPLNFVSTKLKGVPVGFIALNVAIDRLGLEQFPEHWGILPTWSHMPFIKIARKGYCERKIEGRGLSKKIVDTPLKFEQDVEFTAECCNIYRSVCKKLTSIIQSGTIMAFTISAPGDIKEIPSRSGIWNNRFKSIFYTGYIKLEDKRFYRILIHEESFEDYMVPGIRNRPTARDDVLLSRIRRVVEIWTRGGSYKITRKSLDKLVIPVLRELQIERLRAFLEDDVRRNLSTKQPRSQPKKEDTRAFERDMSSLQVTLKKELTRP